MASADLLAYQESWACRHGTVDRPVDQSQLKTKRALNNGRALQDLLHQAAPRYIKALKRARVEATKSDKG